MEITERPPTPFATSEGIVYVTAELWALDRWEGEGPPDLRGPWAIKPKFSVGGFRSCAELAIVDHLRRDGWQGVWVSAFPGAGPIRSEWFPAPCFQTLGQAGAPAWAVEMFELLKAANGGKLSGFFDVFAWREPGQVRFIEAKVGPDSIRDNQRRFVETALRFHHPQEFTIVEVPGIRSPKGTRAAVDDDDGSDEPIWRIARLLRRRNAIDAKMAAILQRPMTSGHLGEWLASHIFDIELERVAQGLDGHFRAGPLQDRTVNIKWYLQREGLLDTSDSNELDFYLVLAGPPGTASSSRGTTRPWCIDAVFLFDARQLRAEQIERGVKQGVASSVIKAQWEAAEIYPTVRCFLLQVTPVQAALLELFRP